MTDQGAADIDGLFAGLVPERVISAYRQLIESGGVPKVEIVEFLGDPDLVGELTRRGMAAALPHTPTTPPIFRATDLESALHGVVGDFHARLSELCRLAADGQARLADLQRHATQLGCGVPEQVLRVVTDRADIMDLTMHFINQARTDFITLETFESDMPMTEDFGIDIAQAVSKGVRVRAIYDMAFAEDPKGSELIERSAAYGEEARVLAKVPMKMQLADKRTVLIPMNRTGTSGVVVMKIEPFVSAMRHFSEMLWAQGTPYGLTGQGPEGQLSPIERRILQLLAAGKQDKAIASAVRLQPHTVRHHILEMRKRLGLKSPSRFAFALAAVRQGWLGGCGSPEPSTDGTRHA